MKLKFSILFLALNLIIILQVFAQEYLIPLKIDSLTKSIDGLEMVEPCHLVRDTMITIGNNKFNRFTLKKNREITYYEFDITDLTKKYTYSVELYIHKNHIIKVVMNRRFITYGYPTQYFVINDSLHTVREGSSMKCALIPLDYFENINKNELPIYFVFLKTLYNLKFWCK